MTADLCYVIGSGPSLRGFDFDQLPDGHRFGANKSGWLAGCDTLVSVDRNFHRNCKTEIASVDGRVYMGLDGAFEQHENVTYWKRVNEEFSWVEGALPGSNSGLAALNLAILLGYREIALLGFDFKWDDTTSHFHDGYVGQNKYVDTQLRNWAAIFTRIARPIRDRGIRVTNFTGPTGSRVQAFPTAPLEELI
jgi:hypothetical protein